MVEEGWEVIPTANNKHDTAVKMQGEIRIVFLILPLNCVPLLLSV
jgi:hypothetical protein